MKPGLKRVLLLSLGLAAGHAQTVEEWPLRTPVDTKDAPPQTEEVIYRSNNYDERGFNRVVQKVAVPTLTIYRPARPAHRGAAVVICPGGGYQYVVVDREGHHIARFLQAQGITAVVLKYRLPDPAAGEAVPRPQQDALAAVQWVRARATEWGLDPRRIGIMGFSAGGHLAGSTAVLGRADDGSRPDFAALLYAVVCLEGPAVHDGSRRNLLGGAPTPERLAEFSLERRVRPDLPPFFLAHARNDKAVPPANSEQLAAALQRAGVPVELLLVGRGGHGFSLGRDEESARWTAAFLQWLDRLP